MDSTPTSIRVSPETYMRLLSVAQELERVQGRRVPMCEALLYVLDAYAEWAGGDDERTAREVYEHDEQKAAQEWEECAKANDE